MRAVVSLTLLVLAASRIDVAEAVAVVRSASLPLLFFAWMLVTLNISILAALRWRALLDARFSMPFALMAMWTFVARSANVMIPGGVAGDVLRVYQGAAYHSKTSLYVSSVVADRLVALAGMSAVSLYGFAVLYSHLAVHGLAVYWALVIGGTCVAIVLLYTGLLGMGVRRLGLSRKTWGRKIVEYSDAVCVYRHHVGRLTKAMLVSVLSVFVNVSVFYVLDRSMAVGLTWQEWLCIAPMVTIISVMPLTVGGLGIRDFSLIYLAGVCGAGRSQALGVSLTYFLLLLVCFGVSGIIYLAGPLHAQGNAKAEGHREGRRGLRAGSR